MHTHRNIHVNEREKEEKSIEVDNYIWENKIILILQNKMVHSLAAASLFTYATRLHYVAHKLG